MQCGTVHFCSSKLEIFVRFVSFQWHFFLYSHYTPFTSKQLFVWKAANGFTGILKQIPHATEVLEQLHDLLVQLQEVPRLIQIYQAAFEYYQRTQPHPSGVPNPDLGPNSTFGARQILALADLYMSVMDYDMVIKTIRSGARWLDGRIHERNWDHLEDDREFDQISTRKKKRPQRRSD